MSMNETPRANRIHIGIFGRTNSGKSTLMNLITGQEVSLVSQEPGTTTDPVYKNMEVPGLGPVVFIDTAGMADETSLGEVRQQRTRRVLDEIDGAIYVHGDEEEEDILEKLKLTGKPILYVNNRLGRGTASDSEVPMDRSRILLELRKLLEDKVLDRPLLEGLAEPGDTVLLVTPQDIQAPKGRLILPQVQTIRELLDRKCDVMITSWSENSEVFNKLNGEPDLIITDSQLFREVYQLKPERSEITSFSVLFAKSKGDIEVLMDGARSLDDLREDSRILIAEACTHAPLEEDIGTVKIPRMLRNKYGENLDIQFSRGKDNFKDLKSYDLIIMCGSCMFNRASVLTRIQQALDAGVSITNYGLTIAYFTGILDDVSY